MDDHRRAYVFPKPGDTLTTLAARLLPDDPGGAKRLLSWNLHLATRRTFSIVDAGGDPRQLLCTDIVYTEPPLP